MVRSLFSALFRRAQRQSPPATATATRFVPTMQSLEAREVPAVLAMFTADTQAVSLPQDAAGDVVVSGDATTTDKVIVQDFHFVMRVSKASPG